MLAVKIEDYVEAARALGNPRWRIALCHILPNILPPLLIQATLSIAAAIIAEAACRSWGSASSRPRRPGAPCSTRRSASSRPRRGWRSSRALIFVIVLAFNLLGDGLRDALDPKER